MKIALDALGGDRGLEPNLEGAARALAESDVELALFGPLQALRAGLAKAGVAADHPRLELVDAPDAIGMDEDPAAACREKPGASILAAAKAVAAGRAAGLVSAGPTGASLVAASWHLKRLPGVLRPAIAAPFPTARGTTVLLDAGANTDCKPWHLLQFAMMGSIYARHALKIERPTVGLLSIGEEESKGNDLVRETLPLLKHAGLEFAGPVEGRDLAAGKTDVVVCDGFVGNVAVKLAEGMGVAMLDVLRASVSASLLYKAGASLMEGAFGDLRRRMSYDEYGGAPLLGVGGTTVICHGRSNAKAIFNAIRVAKTLAETGTDEEIRTSLERMRTNLEFSRVLQ